MLSIADITIDAEFEALLPPLSEQENLELMRLIDAEGFREPVTVWLGHGLIVDGHNRYRIWRDLYRDDEDRCPDVVERHFADRDAVKEWIIRNQLARRNLTDAQRVQVALELKPFIEARALQRMKAGVSDPAPNLAQGTTKKRAPETDDIVAEAAGVSRGTIRKVETVLAKGDDDTKAAMLAPKSDPKHISISKAHKQTVKPERYVEGAASVPKVRDTAPEDSDSDALFTLKRYWKRATKKDRVAFLKWVEDNK